MQCRLWYGNEFSVGQESSHKYKSASVVSVYACVELSAQFRALWGRCFLYGPSSFWAIGPTGCEKTCAEQTVEIEECGADVNWRKICIHIQPESFSFITKSVTHSEQAKLQGQAEHIHCPIFITPNMLNNPSA